MNKVCLIGRLTADPAIRNTNSGIAVASYTLAVDRPKRKDGESSADFIRITAFDKRAEFAEKYLKRGMKIGISGRIQTGSYKDKDGKTVYTTDVLAEEQEFVEGKKDAASAPADAAPSEPAGGDFDFGGDFMSIPDDEDMPFN